MKLHFSLLSLVLTLSLCTSKVEARADVTTHVRRDVSVKSAPLIVIDSDGGSVALRAGAAGVIHVDAEKQASSQAMLDRMTFSTETKDNTLHIVYRQPRDWNGNHSINFTVEAPANSRLQIRTGGGSIMAKGFHAGLQANTGGGSINVQNLSGVLDLKTGGGSIGAEEILGSIKAKTGGGSIRIEGNLKGDNLARTGGGAIEVALPAQSDLFVEASTPAGGIHSDFGTPVNRNLVGGSIKGAIGSGRGGTLKMTTGGGSIHLAKR